MRDVRVHFAVAGVTVRVAQGSLLLDAARHAGVALDAPCGGIGRCGRCRVVVSGEVSPLTDDERSLLSADDAAAGVRLACRARATGSVTVGTAPPIGRIRVTERAAVPRPEVEPPAVRGMVSADPEQPLLGVAVDVGTTTLALAIVDLRNGDELAHASALNPQHTYGADVISRVSAAITGESAALQRAVASEIERLSLSLVARIGVARGDVREFTVVGNTAMRALLLAEDVTPLSAAPYSGAPIEPVTTDTATLGMSAFDAPVIVAPGVSAFIGGDITAGLLATGMAVSAGPALFIDLGTNGEIVLISEGRTVAASAAAGPALEGASIEMGMRAEPGAIERVRLHGAALVAETIDAVPARGICGSGLLDLVAVLLEAGIIDAGGRLRDDATHPLASRVVERADQRVFVVDEPQSVVLTQRDIRELQLAKGAVRTALDMLVERTGLDAENLREIVVAGGFGLHVHPDSLVRIGMIPMAWGPRLRYVGNVALAGAVAMLVDSSVRVRVADLARSIETLDLAAEPDFQKRFIAALDFPQSP